MGSMRRKASMRPPSIFDEKHLGMPAHGRTGLLEEELACFLPGLGKGEMLLTYLHQVVRSLRAPIVVLVRQSKTDSEAFREGREPYYPQHRQCYPKYPYP